ncbi:hypothetical protein NQ038_03395 [Brevibacterium sp. 50QC2O2]|nr:MULTISPECIES: hypothetical protein [unclassified Brevibacterium]MCQ9368905.1 hypothetical protein [Brevibacterium sp. 91QC2O2]MCQ9386022.1 hypothetical protein [Brevibacterium sp. 68QC2CO]MCQ9387687.1 hypothetical protein [Brevibacterium sp. 50QC2O2]
MLVSNPHRDPCFFELIDDAHVLAWSAAESCQIRNDDGGDLSVRAGFE